MIKQDTLSGVVALELTGHYDGVSLGSQLDPIRIFSYHPYMVFLSQTNQDNAK